MFQKRTLHRKFTGGFNSGVGKCPYDPDQEATSMYISKFLSCQIFLFNCPMNFLIRMLRAVCSEREKVYT